MQVIGFDVHKQSFSAAILDRDTGQLRRYQGPVTRQALQQCLSHPGPKNVVFEAGRS